MMPPLTPWVYFGLFLPSVSAKNRLGLPLSSGIYFIWRRWRIIYIGKASNLRRRHGGHHHAFHPTDRIAYFTSPRWAIGTDEAIALWLFAAIWRRRPELNQRFGSPNYLVLILYAIAWAITSRLLINLIFGV